MRDRDPTVTDPAILAKLPAGPAHTIVRFHSYWFRLVWGALTSQHYKGQRLTRLRLELRPMQSRCANAVIRYIGPFEIVSPAPWLEGPARALHPDAFR